LIFSDLNPRRLVGIIGAGHVALRGHVPGWMGRTDFALAAAADPRPEGRAAFQARVPGSRTYSTAGQMLEAERLDCVDVCTPPAAHFGAILDSLARGLDVICEKPLVLRAAEMEEVRSRSGGAGRVVFPVHNWKYAAPLQSASELLRSGAVGRVRRCLWEVFRSRPAGPSAGGSGHAGNWRLDPEIAGGGVLMDHGWHAFYVLTEWLGPGARRVRSRLESLKYKDLGVEDTARVWIDFGEASAEIFLTWAADHRDNRVLIDGTDGRIRISGHTLELESFRGLGQIRQLAESLSEGSYHPDWFGRVIDGYISEAANAAIRGRGLAEAAICLELATLARDSNERGGAWVDTAARDRPSRVSGRRA
jgi:predicted dehydrogenase